MGGGGYVGPDGSSNGQPQGTEYTLQGALVHNGVGPVLHIYETNFASPYLGVMRFLQTEWHRHERDRNAWEIERAEMKSRIGRLEGDVRTSKRLHESLGKHVRLLEAALKKEREKVKKLSNNEKIDDTRDPKEIARESLSALKCMIGLSLLAQTLNADRFAFPSSPTPQVAHRSRRFRS